MKTKNKIYFFGVALFFLSVFFGKTDKAFAATCASFFGTCKYACAARSTSSVGEDNIGTLDCATGQSCCTVSSAIDAYTCAKDFPGFSCVDSTGRTDCKQFECLGGNNNQCCPPTMPASGVVNCTSLGGACSRYCLTSETEKTAATDCAASIPYCCASTNAANNNSTNALGNNSSASTVDCGTNFEKVGGVCFPTNTGLSSASVSSILGNVFSWLMGLFTLFAVGAFVISGIQYLTSAGNEEQAETAKRNATYAVLGILVGLSGFVIVKAIATALSGSATIF